MKVPDDFVMPTVKEIVAKPVDDPDCDWCGEDGHAASDCPDADYLCCSECG